MPKVQKLPITPAVYDALLSSYREHPANHNQAAVRAGCTWRTAKKAWENGWLDKGLPAIEAVIAEEKLQAQTKIRAEMAAKRAAEEAEREGAYTQALEARKQEGQVVQLTRAQSLQNLAVAVQLAQAARVLAPAIKDFVDVEVTKMKAWTAYERGVADGSINPNDPSKVPPFAKASMSAHSATLMIQRITTLNGQIVQTARQAMEMERLHVGEPTNILGVMMNRREMTMEEVEARMMAAVEAFEAFKRTGGAATLDAGLDTPLIGERVVDV